MQQAKGEDSLMGSALEVSNQLKVIFEQVQHQAPAGTQQGRSLTVRAGRKDAS